jgi:hypothetical protein
LTAHETFTLGRVDSGGPLGGGPVTARVYVHIGPHKTGTTFLQQVLERNRPALAVQGVLFPGTPYRRQRQGVRDLVERSGQAHRSLERDRWDALVDEVVAWPGEIAVISFEALSTASPDEIARLVHSLAPVDVHVVYAARDVTKVVTGLWHTYMRNQGSGSWQAWLSAVRDTEAKSPWMWDGQNVRQVLERWEQHVPRERIHVITVPPSGTVPNVLWQRFCAVLGVDPSRHSLEVARTNESLGNAQVELLRRVNEKVIGLISDDSYNRWVQVFIARRVLEQRPGRLKSALPAEDHGWVLAHTNDVIAFLERKGYPVTGDLDDLLPAPADPAAVPPDAFDKDEVLDAAVDVIARLLVKLAAPARRASPTLTQSTQQRGWSPASRVADDHPRP